MIRTNQVPRIEKETRLSKPKVADGDKKSGLRNLSFIYNASRNEQKVQQESINTKDLLDMADGEMSKLQVQDESLNSLCQQLEREIIEQQSCHS